MRVQMRKKKGAGGHRQVCEERRLQREEGCLEMYVRANWTQSGAYLKRTLKVMTLVQTRTQNWTKCFTMLKY
jgi:hypothetical protein